MRLFVSIAAYRDPELVPTLVDCLAKAQWPDRLRLGICWQHGPDEELPSSIKQDSRIQIIDVDWRESKGACWARSQIMGLWQGEDHYLQIDSHHRFAAGWDAKLLANAALTASPKPILTTYCPLYTPGREIPLSAAPTQMTFDAFTEDGIVIFKPTTIPNWTRLTRPVRARFVSGHFLFAPGSFVEEVPYNPDLYFIGEEITLAIRAYTHGYDLFHPSESLLWHEYSRAGRRKHWDDHVETEPVELPWHRRDSQNREEVRRFLNGSQVGRYGCGSIRSFAEYTDYAGINFRDRKVQDYTWRGEEPPDPHPPVNWEDGVHLWDIPIELKRRQLPDAAWMDAHFWYVGLHDASGREIYRHDLSGEELDRLLRGNAENLLIRRRFQSGLSPKTWTVWPVSQQQGWLDKITGPVPSTYTR